MPSSNFREYGKDTSDMIAEIKERASALEEGMDAALYADVYAVDGKVNALVTGSTEELCMMFAVLFDTEKCRDIARVVLEKFDRGMTAIEIATEAAKKALKKAKTEAEDEEE